MIDYSTTPVRGLQAGRLPFLTRLRGLIGVDVTGAPIPPAERALGCDVSHWDGAVNYHTMQAAGARFVYLKATQGTTILDDQYNTSRNNVSGILPFGSYHFLTTADGAAQANWFCDHATAILGALPPVLDVELPSVASSLIRLYCLQHYMRLNQYPMIYTSAYYWGLVTGTDKAWISDHCPLFVANWGTDNPILPAGWTTYAVHQYSGDGNHLGHTYGGQADSMDLNRTRNTWLNQYAPISTVTHDEWDHLADAYLRTIGYTGPGPE